MRFSWGRESNGTRENSVHGKFARKRTLVTASPKLENIIKVDVK